MDVQEVKALVSELRELVQGLVVITPANASEEERAAGLAQLHQAEALTDKLIEYFEAVEAMKPGLMLEAIEAASGHSSPAITARYDRRPEE